MFVYATVWVCACVLLFYCVACICFIVCCLWRNKEWIQIFLKIQWGWFELPSTSGYASASTARLLLVSCSGFIALCYCCCRANRMSAMTTMSRYSWDERRAENVRATRAVARVALTVSARRSVAHLRGFSRDSLRRLRFYNRQKKRRKPQMHRNQNVNCRDLPQDNRRLPPTKSIVGRTIGVARIFDLGGSCKFSWLTSFTLDISHSPWHSVQFFYVTTRMRVQL